MAAMPTMNDPDWTGPDWTGTADEDDLGPVLPRRRMVDDAEMDITPMIDITFLLLIFFLVTSIADPATAIDLPRAEYGDGVDSRITAPVTFVAGNSPDVPLVYMAEGRDDQRLLPEDEASQMAELERYFNEELAAGKSAVLILAEREVRYRHVSRVVNLASRLGLTTHVAVAEAY